ncbi:MAG: hypothetical protein GC180_12840 [Bacteroidetes bacterium]|nr:hypothetical protein [Bacteroidota bacterium]
MSGAEACVNASWSTIGRFQLSRIFDASINSTSNSANPDHILQITVKDANATTLLVWKSNLFRLQNGDWSLSNLGVGPSSGQFLSGGDFYNSTTYVESGTYDVEYELSKEENGSATLICQNIKSIESGTFPSIQLIQVEDQDTLTEKFPVFTWSAFMFPEPPGDGINSFDMEYAIRIKQVFNNQSNMDAMEFNPTHHEWQSIKGSSYAYPFNARPFGDSAIYVWKIEARVRGQLISNSEVWRFVYCPKPPKVINAPVITLNPERGTSTTVVRMNVLKVGYLEKMGPPSLMQLTAEIRDVSGNVIADSDRLNFMAKQGFNIFSMNLCPDGLNLSDGNYKLLLFDLNGKKMELNFRYTRTNECE